MLRLVQARNHCSNHCCCGLRNNSSDVWRWQAHRLDPCSCVSRDASCRLVLVCVSAVGRNREILKILKAQHSSKRRTLCTPPPSVQHLAVEQVLSSVPRPQPMSDASRLWSFGRRPSDIPNFLGLDKPVTGCCQVGSIVETSPNCVCQVRYEMSLIKRGSY